MKTNNVIYLKEGVNDFHTYYTAYDKTNLTRVEVSKSNIEFEKFKDSQDLNWNLGYDLKDKECVECTREEFNDFYTSQSLILNEIIKQL